MERGFILQSIFLLKDITLQLHGTQLKEPLRKVTEQELVPDSFFSLNLRQKLQSCKPSSSSKSQVLPLDYKAVFINY